MVLDFTVFNLYKQIDDFQMRTYLIDCANLTGANFSKWMIKIGGFMIWKLHQS